MDGEYSEPSEANGRRALLPFTQLQIHGPLHVRPDGTTYRNRNGAPIRRKREAAELLKELSITFNGTNKENTPAEQEYALANWLHMGIGGLSAMNVLKHLPPENEASFPQLQRKVMQQFKGEIFSTRNIVYAAIVLGKLTVNGLDELRRLQPRDQSVIGATRNSIADENKKAAVAAHQDRVFLETNPEYDLETIGSVGARTITWSGANAPVEDPNVGKGYGVQVHNLLLALFSYNPHALVFAKVESIAAAIDVLNKLAEKSLQKSITKIPMKFGWDWAADGNGGTMWVHLNHIEAPDQEGVAVVGAACVKDKEANLDAYFKKAENSVISQVTTCGCLV